jgi:hypothetical protein
MNRMPGTPGPDSGSWDTSSVGCQVPVLGAPGLDFETWDTTDHAVTVLGCETTNYPFANSLARSVARITALMRVTRRPPSSNSRMPSMVQPAGVVTASFSRAGW